MIPQEVIAMHETCILIACPDNMCAGGKPQGAEVLEITLGEVTHNPIVSASIGVRLFSPVSILHPGRRGGGLVENLYHF